MPMSSSQGSHDEQEFYIGKLAYEIKDAIATNKKVDTTQKQPKYKMESESDRGTIIISDHHTTFLDKNLIIH